MSRFYLSLKDKPNVIIEYSEDLKEAFYPKFETLFGTVFVAAEKIDNKLHRHEFVANEVEFDELADWLKQVYEERIVKEINIDISLN